MRRSWRGAAALGLAIAAGAVAAVAPRDDAVAQRTTTLTRNTRWTPVAAIRLPFRTFHPQGMVRIGENFYVSSVEVRQRPEKFATPHDGQDRSAGSGIGHLFKIGPDGRLLADLIVGEGTAYHPGGIDYDGRSIWVPVSEYRPNSRAIIYRVDPATMTATEAFRWKDHIGGIVHDTQDRTLVGISWGSRTFYRWPIDSAGKPDLGGDGARSQNPAQYIDYQDCHYAGGGQMLCAGVADYTLGPNAGSYALGGLELVDLKARRPVWQAPIELRSPTGRPMTQNPFWAEATPTGLRVWFLPDDDTSTLFVFDATPGR